MQERTLTRRRAAAFANLNQQFVLYSKADLLAQLQAWQAARPSRRPSEWKKLEAMLQVCGIEADSADAAQEDPQALAGRIAASSLPENFFDTDNALEMQMVYSLYAYIDEYATPQDFMQRLVDSLSHPEDKAWEKNSLRLRILKQFIKYGNYLASVKRYEESKKPIQDYVREKFHLSADDVKDADKVCAVLDEDVYSLIALPAKKCAVLQLSYDLANGRFRERRTSRLGLYLFAIVYDMTYYPGWISDMTDFDLSSADLPTGGLPNYRGDIEKNLFYDYYTNNLFQYLGEGYEEIPAMDIPSEYGINYKNFEEMIFLYYIVTPDLLPQEKIKRAWKMIQAVKAEQAQRTGQAAQQIDQETKSQRTDQGPQTEQAAQASQAQAAPDQSGRTVPNIVRGEGATLHYRNLAAAQVFDPGIPLMDEATFKEFILSNYDCNPGKGKSDFMLGAEEGSPYQQFQKLLAVFSRKTEQTKAAFVAENPLYFVNLNIGAGAPYANFQAKAAAYKHDVIARCFQNGIPFNPIEFHNLMKLFSLADRFLKSWVTVEDPAHMSRTALLALAYYTVCDDIEADNYPDYFMKFQRQADIYLMNAGYQAVSGNNIFDVILSFSAYLYAR